MTYIRVCDLGILPADSMKQFLVDGREILAINAHGNVYCLSARCTHAGAPLAEGEVEDDVLTCPWHGSQFKISNGEVIRGPAKQKLATFNCLVKDNMLFADL